MFPLIQQKSWVLLKSDFSTGSELNGVVQCGGWAHWAVGKHSLLVSNLASLIDLKNWNSMQLILWFQRRQNLYKSLVRRKSPKESEFEALPVLWQSTQKNEKAIKGSTAKSIVKLLGCSGSWSVPRLWYWLRSRVKKVWWMFWNFYMIKFFFSSKKQLFSKLNLHSSNLCPLLGLGFRVWRLGSRDKGLGFRV